MRASAAFHLLAVASFLTLTIMGCNAHKKEARRAVKNDDPVMHIKIDDLAIGRYTEAIRLN